MLIVRVEFHNPNGGHVTELARMKIVNNGRGSIKRGCYQITTYRGKGADLDLEMIGRVGHIHDWPRETHHIWELVMNALAALGYHILKRAGRGGMGTWIMDEVEHGSHPR